MMSSGSVQALVVNNIRNFLPPSFCFACWLAAPLLHQVEMYFKHLFKSNKVLKTHRFIQISQVGKWDKVPQKLDYI